MAVAKKKVAKKKGVKAENKARTLLARIRELVRSTPDYADANYQTFPLKKSIPDSLLQQIDEELKNG